MITFLPSADFDEVARMLDDKRLGGQRTEAWSILKWLRQPALYPKLVKAGYCAMWDGFEGALVKYVNAMLVEWARRGKKNDLLQPYDPALGLQEAATSPHATMAWLRGAPWLSPFSTPREATAALRAIGWREQADAYNGSYPWPVRESETGNWVLRWPKHLKLPTRGDRRPRTLVPASAARQKRKRDDSASAQLPPGAKPGPLFGQGLMSEAEQSARPMSKVLFYGRKHAPRALVVLLHGLTDTADGWHGSFAGRWARGLPGVLVAVPQSPDECGAYSPHQPGWSCKGDRKYDWLAQPGAPVDPSDWPACVATLQAVTRARVSQLHRWIDTLLATHGLTNRELVLVGFSQGSILATIAGTRRHCRGVVAVGGVPGQPIYDAVADDYVGGGWMEWERMVDVSAKATTRLCLINGTKDSYVSRTKNEAMFKPFKDVTWHWETGLGHDFPEHWYGTALRWIKRLL